MLVCQAIHHSWYHCGMFFAEGAILGQHAAACDLPPATFA
jgi:hypothetical protein